MNRYTMVAFTNAVPGREDEFNQWYGKQHMPDVLNCQGFVGGRRFEASPEQRGAPPPYRHMAIYDLETDDLAGTISAMLARVGTSDMPMSSALQDERVVWTYRPLDDD